MTSKELDRDEKFVIGRSELLNMQLKLFNPENLNQDKLETAEEDIKQNCLNLHRQKMKESKIQIEEHNLKINEFESKLQQIQENDLKESVENKDFEYKEEEKEEEEKNSLTIKEVKKENCIFEDNVQQDEKDDENKNEDEDDEKDKNYGSENENENENDKLHTDNIVAMRLLISKLQNQSKKNKPKDDPLVFRASDYGFFKSKTSSSPSYSTKNTKPTTKFDAPIHPAHKFEEIPKFQSALREMRNLLAIQKNCKKICQELDKKLEDEGIHEDSPKEEWIFIQSQLEDEKKKHDFVQTGKKFGSLFTYGVEKFVQSTHFMGLEAQNLTENFDKNWTQDYEPHFQQFYYDTSIPILRELPPAVNFANSYFSNFQKNHMEQTKLKMMNKTSNAASNDYTNVKSSEPYVKTNAEKKAYAESWFKRNKPKEYEELMNRRRNQSQLEPVKASDQDAQAKKKKEEEDFYRDIQEDIEENKK